MKTPAKKKLLFVVQRFGLEVDGGAELYCRWLVKNLSGDFDVDVLTTCAINYITWANEYPEGRAELLGIPVIRFRVDHERDIDSFDSLTGKILSENADKNQQMFWLNAQGPVSSGLLKYIDQNSDQYDALIFITYLYHPTVMGTLIAPSKSILIPTAHDEPVAHLSIYHELYKRVGGLLFLTDPEAEYVRKTYDVGSVPNEVLGTGIAIPAPAMSASEWIQKYDLKPPVILYIGRVERGKGCMDLVENYLAFRSVHEASGTLVLAGRTHMDLARDENVRFLGFIPDDEIAPALSAAEVVVAPSPFESLSILLLQGLSQGKPVLANGNSSVLRDHIIQSNAGLYYTNEAEFELTLALLLDRSDLRFRMGENGRRYVSGRFTWPIVMRKFSKFLNECQLSQ
jgi:glycosyltransferase involved in cell wall biosynthesis